MTLWFEVAAHQQQDSPNALATKPAGLLQRPAGWIFGATRFKGWQGQRESNPQPSVLETDALPIELCPCGNLNVLITR